MNNRITLSHLLQSKSRSAKFLGFGIALFLFLPTVFRVVGDDTLTIWQRLEQLSIAAGQTLFTVAIAAIPPEAIAGGETPVAENEV